MFLGLKSCCKLGSSHSILYDSHLFLLFQLCPYSVGQWEWLVAGWALAPESQRNTHFDGLIFFFLTLHLTYIIPKVADHTKEVF